MTSPKSILRKLSFLAPLFALVFGLAAAHAQSDYYYNESTPVSGGGTLGYQLEVENGYCGNDIQNVADMFQNFTYTPAGGSATGLSGAIDYVFSCDSGYYNISGGWDYESNSYSSDDWSNQLNLSYGSCTITFNAYEGGGGSASINCPPPPVGMQGLLYPKYVVVGVTYAPPGNGSGAVSTVQYTGTTAVGTTTTNGSSFSNDVGFSVSFQNGVGTPGGTTLAGGGVSLTATESTDYTQTSNNSSSITLNKSTSTSYTTNGYPTTFPITWTGAAPNINPSAIAAGSTINPHDWDVIQLWLNAEQAFTAFATTPVSFQWNGYAYDPADLAGPDVYPIQVGCLNGDFTVAYCATQQGVLNRAWDTDEMSPTTEATVTAAGCPETSESPSICPNTQDAYNILAADPLAYNPGGSTYTLLDSSPLPTTTSDGRFTQFGYPPNPVDYETGQTEGYTLTQMDTQTESNGGSSQVNEKVSVSEKVSAGFLGLVQSSITFTESDTMIWTNTWLNSLTTTQTVQNAFTIKGSNPPNYVPGEFISYQDNTFGTFMFYPSN